MVNEIKKSIKRIKKDGSNLSTCWVINYEW
jgi:hypothetical protein